jgi:hypothetical protein
MTIGQSKRIARGRIFLNNEELELFNQAVLVDKDINKCVSKAARAALMNVCKEAVESSKPELAFNWGRRRSD